MRQLSQEEWQAAIAALGLTREELGAMSVLDLLQRIADSQKPVEWVYSEKWADAVYCDGEEPKEKT
jgi:hypothetical protein